jgi:retron-type reverse transcriptase
MQLAIDFKAYSPVCTSVASPESLLEDLFAAYFECRKNKRNTANALAFELNLEENLLQLFHDIRSGRYRPGRSVAFIVNKPVKREIFAAGFRDRVVHHYIIGKLNPYFEKLFIEDSYACRKGKGTHYGIRRMMEHIRQASENYQSEAYVLKLDIRGFFMHINRQRLYQRLEDFVKKVYQGSDRELILWLSRLVIYNNPAQNCLRKGSAKDWEGLPPDKSLFHSPADCGLPIGNLSSQVFANFYLHLLDAYIRETLGFASYGRYVDDFVLVHRHREKLKAAVPTIETFLKEQLGLRLHPHKRYLQAYGKGLPFLGAVLYPGRILAGRRCKGNFYWAIQKFNQLACRRPLGKSDVDAFLSSINSYMGTLKHMRSYRLRRRIVHRNLIGYWWQQVGLRRGCRSFRRKSREGFAGSEAFPKIQVNKMFVCAVGAENFLPQQLTRCLAIG